MSHKTLKEVIIFYKIHKNLQKIKVKLNFKYSQNCNKSRFSGGSNRTQNYINSG